jgi:hypothetical protein
MAKSAWEQQNNHVHGPGSHALDKRELGATSTANQAEVISF